MRPLHLFALALPGIASAQSTVPSGFVDELVGGGFEAPTGIAVAPDGRVFVSEKRGLVWIIENGAVLPVPFIDLQDEVGNANDRGLMGIALDPAFDLNGLVYLAYVVDNCGSGSTVSPARILWSMSLSQPTE